MRLNIQTIKNNYYDIEPKFHPFEKEKKEIKKISRIRII
jgi:hypothetical protein